LNDAAAVGSYRELMAGRTIRGGAMRRSKRLTIIRIGLAVATLGMTLPVAAQAKPLPRDPIQAEYQARAVPVIDSIQAEYQARAVPVIDSIQAEYQARAVPVIDTKRVVSSKTPDDRGFARTYDEQPVLVSDGGSSFDVNQYAATGFGLALVLMAGGMGLAIRHNRKSKLSPA
jgi:hypothetical protein